MKLHHPIYNTYRLLKAIRFNIAYRYLQLSRNAVFLSIVMQLRNSYLVGKAFRNYLGASILAVAATQVAGIVDAAIVGNLIGQEGLAAVNLCKPVVQAVFAASCLYVTSSSMLAGIAIGKGIMDQSNRLLTLSLTVSVLLGLLITLEGFVIFKPLSAMLCSSETLRPMTDEYLGITLLSTIPMLLMYTLQSFVTVDGSPTLVSRAVIVGNIFNLACDIIFIKYFGWGIAGAAWATFIMYIICTLMVLPHFRKKGTMRLCRFRMRDIDHRQIFAYGLPMFLSTVLLSVQFVGNNYVAGTYMGDDGLVALAVCIQLFFFSMIILTGTIRTIQPVGSILRGISDDHGMLLLMLRAYRFMTLCLAVFAIVIIIFPTEIARVLGADSESSLLIIRTALPAFTLHIVMQALLCCLIPAYQFYDHKRLAFLISVGQTLLPMVGFWVLRGRWIGFFLGQAVVAIIVLISVACYRHRNHYRHTPIFLIPKSDGENVYDITVRTDIQVLAETRRSIGAFLQSLGINTESTRRYVLCVEELLKNIIEHGHARYVDVRATGIAISLHDDGKPFNPIEYAVPEACNEQDTENHLGLKIVHGLISDISYDYRFNQNMVTIRIKDNNTR